MYANLERTDKVSENDLSKIMMEHGALVGDIEDWLGY